MSYPWGVCEQSNFVNICILQDLYCPLNHFRNHTKTDRIRCLELSFIKVCIWNGTSPSQWLLLKISPKYQCDSEPSANFQDIQYGLYSVNKIWFYCQNSIEIQTEWNISFARMFHILCLVRCSVFILLTTYHSMNYCEIGPDSIKGCLCELEKVYDAAWCVEIILHLCWPQLRFLLWIIILI